MVILVSLNKFDGHDKKLVYLEICGNLSNCLGHLRNLEQLEMFMSLKEIQASFKTFETFDIRKGMIASMEGFADSHQLETHHMVFSN